MMSTPQLLAMVQNKYGPPEHTFLTEVRNGTGFTKTPRTADALAFNLWPSRGMELLGFELKVSRQDWKHELKQPEKADAIANYCDRWWVVAGDEKVVLDPAAELPKTWGLQTATDKGLKIVREAPLNENPKPLDRHLIWAIIRRFGSPAESVIEEARREGLARGRKETEKRIEEVVRSVTNERDRLQESLRQFKQLTGMDLHDWRYGRVVEVANFLQKGGIDGIRRDLNQLKKHAKDISDAIETILNYQPAGPVLTDGADGEERPS